MTRRLWVSALLACAALYALALVAAGRATGFHVGLNDFWGNYYLSSAADLSRPGTLYNGFFPFGYTLATRLIGGGSPAFGMFLVNVALAVLLALSVAMSVFAAPLQRYTQAAASQLRDRSAYFAAVLGEHPRVLV